MRITETLAANQHILEDNNSRVFQSYKSIIAVVTDNTVSLSPHWDYSRTTMKYLGRFLNTNAKGIRESIKSGEYKLNINTEGEAI